MKRNSLISLALAALLLLSCMVGCASSNTPTHPQDPGASGPEPSTPGTSDTPKTELPAPAVPLASVTNAKNLGFTEFDDQLVEYLKQA